jgi:hypothetical protein
MSSADWKVTIDDNKLAEDRQSAAIALARRKAADSATYQAVEKLMAMADESITLWQEPLYVAARRLAESDE